MYRNSFAQFGMNSNSSLVCRPSEGNCWHRQLGNIFKNGNSSLFRQRHVQEFWHFCSYLQSDQALSVSFGKLNFHFLKSVLSNCRWYAPACRGRWWARGGTRSARAAPRAGAPGAARACGRWAGARGRRSTGPPAPAPARCRAESAPASTAAPSAHYTENQGGSETYILPTRTTHCRIKSNGIGTGSVIIGKTLQVLFTWKTKSLPHHTFSKRRKIILEPRQLKNNFSSPNGKAQQTKTHSQRR